MSMQLALFLQRGGDKVAVMTTKCIQRLAKDLDHSWLEHFRSIDDREMATFPGGEAWIDNDCTTTPESSRSVSPYQEISAPRGPWHLEMAPLSSITPDENNQYYPARNKKFDKKEVPLKIWRQPTLTSKPQISQARSFSMSDGETALKFGRNRLTSVPVLQEVHQQQKSPDLSELEEDSLFTAIFPEKVQDKIHPTASYLPASLQPEPYSGYAIRNVLDFTLQDYYGGLSEIMNGLSVSPKVPTTSTSSQTQTVSATFLNTEPDATSPQAVTKPDIGVFEPNTYSKKVFVGGLPPDLDADDIKRHFIQFGDLLVDWPHKARTRALFPPKGYAFLLFRQEIAVHKLLQACLQQEDKFFVFLSSTSLKDKKVQVRPWFLSDSEFYYDKAIPADPRKTVFIGGVPRPMKASELAEIMNERFGSVCYAAIDLDTDVNYPKGAGRVSFKSTNSFISAVSSRFFQMTYGDVNKGVEVKPYVMDDQMCDECHGVQCNGKYAPFYCGSVSCLQYYCEHCWATVHALPSKHNHRPLTKDTGDRPRAMPFRGHYN